MLNTVRGARPDDIPNIFLKNCKFTLANPLQILFQKSISLVIFPTRWKISSVCPIHKKGDRPNIKLSADFYPQLNTQAFWINYPILYQKVESFISEQKHGFMQSKTTASNLTMIIEYPFPIWSLYFRTEINTIERAQHRYFRRKYNILYNIIYI